MKNKYRKGSALLIVLGMTAFMVISAVAFSAFMRYSRLPSSYLRRTTSSRHIVKAALAEAIDQIDAAIGDDPFTFEFTDRGFTTAEGFSYGNNSSDGYDYPRADDSKRKIRARRACRNFWRGHVFIGTNELVYADETISTLTLEALAYLPPALINEARYYSRHSVAGRWHSLGFDVGRYAFCAVDVSDHIDVNRVLANMGRNSSDRGRITLAHVFENHGSAPPVNAAGWDAFMDQFLDVTKIKDGEPDAYTGATKLPLISLADLNLAINKKGWLPMTPFCDYVVNQKNDYISSAGQQSEIIRQMAFVTDSYFPNTNDATTAKYDLCYSQPFRRIEAGNVQMSVDDIMGNNAEMMSQKLLKHISDIDKIALYDYLDENDIPASLALPSVERVPMVCGIQPQGKIDFEVKQTWGEGGDPNAVAPTAADPETKTFEKVYKIDNAGMNQVMLSGLFLYPFRRDDAQNPPMGSFKAEYAVRLGFCDVTTGNGRGPGLRTNKSSPFVVQNKSDFNGDAKRLEGGVIKLFKQGRSVGSKKVNGEKDAVELDSPVEMADFSDKLNGQELFKVKYIYHKQAIPNSDPPTYIWTNPEIDQNATPWVNGDFFPLAADGSSLRDTLVNKLKTQGEIETRPFLTVAVRVTQGNKVVDLAPASMIDDQKYNDVNNSAVATMQEFGGIGGIADNGQQPVITIAGDASQTFKFGESGTGRFQTDLKPANGGNSFICPDPRWNFAPENFGVTSDALQAGDWFIQKCGTGSVVGGGNGRRDNDVFMACSNQGYMQSPSEIAFLPRTIDRELKRDQVQETMSGDIALNQRIGNYADGMVQYNDPSAIGNLLHGAFMWRTYTPYAKNGFGADELYAFGVTSGGTGFRVNPYSASADILMAALVHAPYSWWAASTNDNSVAFQAADNAETFNRTYAFCEDNNDAEMAWDDLKKVAAELKNKMRDPAGDWEYGYDDAWNIMNDAQANAKATYRDYLCGVELSGNTCDLYEVDRKMLYGFWRDSFAAKQQLFLIFVRAEPMMMGGGAVGQTPPQLGARAVALVWRDPTPTPPDKIDVGNNQPRPHRTRVLFYRQFD